MAINVLCKEEIVGPDKKRKAIISSRIRYSNIDEVAIRRDFNSLLANGIIVEGEYPSDRWVALDRYKDYSYAMDFSLEYCGKELKVFILLLLKNRQPSTVSRYYRFLRNIIEETNGFRNKVMEDYFKGKAYRPDDVVVLVRFMDFLGITAAESRLTREQLNKYVNNQRHGSRTLPTFQSIILFDRLIDNFAGTELVNHPEYYPIVLWWKFTMVIPTRPIEFFQLKVKDFYCKDNKYMVHLLRSLKSGKDDEEYPIPLITEYEMTREIYELFQNYIKTINVGSEGFLFNSDGIETRYPREFMGRRILDNLLDDFYAEVVFSYGYEIIEKGTVDYLEEGQIEKINYGDTRHLAFLNMILSGYNPYTIAQLGGHRNLVTQNSYYAGLTTFCASKAYSLAFGIIDLANANAFAMSEWRKNELIKSSIDFSKAIKLDNGYCTSMHYPYDCSAMKCSEVHCVYYWNDNLEEIEERKNNIKQDIQHKANVLASLIHDPNDSTVREEAANGLQEDIIKLAHVLQNERFVKKDGH